MYFNITLQNLIGIVLDSEKKGCNVILWNFTPKIQSLLKHIEPKIVQKITEVVNIEGYVTGMLRDTLYYYMI